MAAPEMNFGAQDAAGFAMNPWLYGGMKIGGALLGALGGDPNEQYRKLQERFLRMQMEQRQAGFGQIQSALRNPGAYKNQLMMSLAPEFNQIGRNVSQRVGLDSGAGQGELARSMQGRMAGGMMDRNKMLMQLLAQYR